jgi:hypothetical protein
MMPPGTFGRFLKETAPEDAGGRPPPVDARHRMSGARRET